MKHLFFCLLLVLFPFNLLGQQDTQVIIGSSVLVADGQFLFQFAGHGTVFRKHQELEKFDIVDVITAAHVISDFIDRDITICINEKDRIIQRIEAVLLKDIQNDVAVIRVKVPKGIKIAELYVGDANKREEISVLIRRSNFQIPQEKIEYPLSLEYDNRIFLDGICYPGDSGSGVFKDGKLIGVLSGGWRWIKDSDKKQATWPVTAIDVRKIAIPR